MEQAKHWMWTRGKFPGQPLLDSRTIPTATSTLCTLSWEERAFAEDSAGLLGGCIWPPRSYNCSFCGRQFRSAQALGGHMNVHRRDRARFKQSSIDDEEEEDDHDETHLDTIATGDAPGLVYQSTSPNQKANPNPNPKSGMRPATIGVSLSEFKEYSRKKLLEGFSHTGLGVGLELKLGRKGQSMDSGLKRSLDARDEQQICCKKKRMDSTSCPLFLMPSNIVEHDAREPEPDVIDPSPEMVEELDLELRLGDLPPKVKVK
ncbi:hypothetical protein HPP92_013911 [Vanilla planifolia]|uniref:C2H2-type domain-containing protein n=1 Tax=Vanilla planifolia TaxID=51239 RepID=A0A835R2W4_VANPL|nr:hypothetical protein HPP92_013911 [Vanilla planifolia]